MVSSALSRERGFILVTLIFLVLVGALLLAAMAFLYGTASAEQGTQNAGAQAFLAAESGDQYGVYYLETQYSGMLPPRALTLPAQTPSVPDPSCPPVVTVTKAGGHYLVQSVATCVPSGARWTVTRTVQAKVQKKPKMKKGRLKKAGRILYTVTAWGEQ